MVLALFCLRTRSLERWTKNGFLNVIMRRKETFWLLGFSTCLSLLVEEKVSHHWDFQRNKLTFQKRRAELGKLENGRKAGP